MSWMSALSSGLGAIGSGLSSAASWSPALTQTLGGAALGYGAGRLTGGDGKKGALIGGGLGALNYGTGLTSGQSFFNPGSSYNFGDTFAGGALNGLTGLGPQSTQANRLASMGNLTSDQLASLPAGSLTDTYNAASTPGQSMIGGISSAFGGSSSPGLGSVPALPNFGGSGGGSGGGNANPQQQRDATVIDYVPLFLQGGQLYSDYKEKGDYARRADEELALKRQNEKLKLEKEKKTEEDKDEQENFASAAFEASGLADTVSRKRR